MHLGIIVGKLCQGVGEPRLLVKGRRSVSGCLIKFKIANGDRHPWILQDVCVARQNILSQPIEVTASIAPTGEFASQYPCLICRCGHALAVDRIETHDRVADWQEAIRKSSHCFVMPVKVGREGVGCELADSSCPDALRDIGGEGLGILNESAGFGGWIVSEPAAQTYNPLAILDPEACTRACAFSNSQADMWVRITEGNFDQAGNVTNVDVDLRNARLFVAKLSQPLSAPGPSATRIDHQISLKRRVPAVTISHSNTNNPVVTA